MSASLSRRLSAREWRVLWWLGVAAALAGCGRGFQPRDFATPEALFRAALAEFQGERWENAQAGFERLTADLSARDPLMAPATFYLAMTHERRREYLLAAQAYERITDGFPDDTLAPTAMLGVGRSYQSLWRRPSLDPEQGQKAVAILRALLSSYPEAKEGEDARRRIAELEEWFARKDYDTGIHYVKVRRAVDPAIIYFKDVVTTYPSTKAARLSWLRLHELYTRIRWKEDVSETCQAMWKAYPGDAEVAAHCGAAPAEAAKADTAVVPPPPRDTVAGPASALAAPLQTRARPGPGAAPRG
jgi:outer membrane protein assembly factor BamD